MSDRIYALLTDIAGRCNLRNDKILRKSKELLSLLNSKPQVICSDTCKVIVCLELASSLTSTPLNREDAIKYSGCKKKNYTNIYNNISKLLNLDKLYSVKEICLLTGTSDIQQNVQKLLDKFKIGCQDLDSDFEHPMYSCAALLAFCKQNKIKISQPKIVEISRIKKYELDDLVKKFQPFLVIKEDKKKSEKTKTQPVTNNSPAFEDELTPRKKKASAGVMSDKEYEEWKRKMLDD